MSGSPPQGYDRRRVRRSTVVARHDILPALVDILAHGGLYEYAASRPDRVELAGRGPAYAIGLTPSGTRVVVRHNRHGGLLARATGDLFLRPTRAPRELTVSLRLAAAGIPTPVVVAYVTYGVAGVLARADVVTREIAPARDLGAFLARSEPDARRAAALDATIALVDALARVGARHHDLNVKNVLLRPDGDAFEALALDVDRVTFQAGDVMTANVARLSRSARKWRERQGATVDESELAVLARSVFEASLSAVTRS